MNSQPTRPEPVEGLANPEAELTPEAELNSEDGKIIKLARAARARTGAAEAACIRDTDGRTYVATNVDLPHLRLSAVAVAVAMGVSSGAPGLEAVARVAHGALSDDDAAVIADLGGDQVTILHADPDGRPAVSAKDQG